MLPVFKDKEVVFLSSSLESSDKVLVEVFKDVDVCLEQTDVRPNALCQLSEGKHRQHIST